MEQVHNNVHTYLFNNLVLQQDKYFESLIFVNHKIINNFCLKYKVLKKHIYSYFYIFSN